MDKNRLVQCQLLICDAYYLKNLTYFSASSQFSSVNNIGSHDNTNNSEKTKLLVNNLNNTCLRKIFNFAELTRIALPHKLEYISLSGTLTTGPDSLKELIFYGKNSLKYLNYGSNGLHVIEGPVILAHDPPSPMTIDLSDNGCHNVGPDFFKYMTNATGVLYLSHNRLGEQFMNEPNCSIFQQLTLLTELHLAFNEIKTIPQLIFINQLELNVLNLSHNSLQFLDFHLDHMVKLTYLDLSANLIVQLDTHYTDLWNSVPNNLSIDLKGNPLICSCESMRFLRWMIVTEVSVTDWQNYTCTYKRHFQQLTQIEQILRDLTIECYSKQWVLIASLTVGFVALLISIIIVVYRHKFEVKVFCLKLTYQWKQYQSLLDERCYDYDAFVAFHENDLHFVVNDLVNNLEEKSGFKLCIHHRDFIVGGCIEESILAAIDRSRKTIVILSESFLKSGWCDFEYKMARVKGFDEGVDIIIPIIKGELMSNVENMSRSIRVLLKKNTYIQWPEHQNQVDDFWIKVKTALR